MESDAPPRRAVRSHSLDPPTPIRGSLMNVIVAALARVCTGLAFALISVSLLSVSLSAQTVIQGVIGVEFRYRGDTIWRERDSTMTRVVFRGDTAIRANYLHGKVTSTTIYVLAGDEATLVQYLNADGKPGASSITPRTTSTAVVLGERQMLESAIRSSAMTQRMAGMGVGMPGNDAPLSPATVQTYAMSANRNLVQHGDTVRYITGCAAVGRADTTVYLLFANDSLKRLSPNPRTFGHTMATAVRSDMGGVLLRQRVSRDPSEFNGLPGPPKWPCDMR